MQNCIKENKLIHSTLVDYKSKVVTLNAFLSYLCVESFFFVCFTEIWL